MKRYTSQENFFRRNLIHCEPESVSQCENHMDVILSQRGEESNDSPFRESEILRLLPQDDIANTVSNEGERNIQKFLRLFRRMKERHEDHSGVLRRAQDERKEISK